MELLVVYKRLMNLLANSSIGTDTRLLLNTMLVLFLRLPLFARIIGRANPAPTMYIKQRMESVLSIRL